MSRALDDLQIEDIGPDVDRTPGVRGFGYAKQKSKDFENDWDAESSDDNEYGFKPNAGLQLNSHINSVPGKRMQSFNAMNKQNKGPFGTKKRGQSMSKNPNSSSEYNNIFYGSRGAKNHDSSQAGNETSFHSEMMSNNDSDISAVPMEQRERKIYYDASSPSNSPAKKLGKARGGSNFKRAIPKAAEESEVFDEEKKQPSPKKEIKVIKKSGKVKINFNFDSDSDDDVQINQESIKIKTQKGKIKDTSIPGKFMSNSDIRKKLGKIATEENKISKMRSHFEDAEDDAAEEAVEIPKEKTRNECLSPKKIAFVTEEDKQENIDPAKNKRGHSSSLDSSDSKEEAKEEFKDEVKIYLNSCSGYKTNNDPLHKNPTKLQPLEKQMKLQAAYLNYVFEKPLEEAKELLARPIPKEIGTLMLTIVRNKSGLSRWKPKYTLVAFLVNKSSKSNECKELLVGKKRSNNKKPTYLISLDISNPKPKGPAYVGKVKLVNKKKTNFVVYDHGLNPKKDRKPKWRKTLCDLQFENKKIPKFGTARIATASFVPIEDNFLTGRKFQDYLRVETHEIIRLMKSLVVCESKMPSYDKEKNKYVMNFQSRAGAKSVKSTSLILKRLNEEKENNECQIGDEIFSLCRWDKTRFNLDLQYPMSILSAFGTALSIFELG
ncbi:unnamed protein product [Moneuplotes crassus]|uniref:Tubby C-terminal domain-containing protein n=1 Tax=Euplotes crassus TaxID=5936 RepID=A0AAD1TZH5_EUPCR|nr:unnamed protein product [Moneuplotes crassus]